MSGRPPDKFVLKRKDRALLLDVLRDGQTPLKVARRALILLGRADGQQSIAALEEKVEQDRTTIWRVCERYEDGGVDAALYDAPRSGRPRVFSPASTPED
ncbi:MAG TPA: helix-turn-helix domain-containing protein [Anaerolineae bacterium]|nr:helix-turn-helix domain-containing protein [Anaerolineae bacterium]